MTTAQPAIADVLSASSLVVAIIAAFLTLWLADTHAAMNAFVERDPANRQPQRDLVRQALMRVRPLALIAVIALLILLPRAWTIVAAGWTCATVPTVRAKCEYNDVFALFIVVTGVLAGLAGTLAAQVLGLLAKWRELSN